MRNTQRRITPARAIQQPTAYETIDVSPLIDVGFLLLIFFLVTSSLRKEETGLPTAIPGGVQTNAVETFTVDLRATSDGSVSVNGRVLATDPTQRSMPEVVRELKISKNLARAAGGPILVMIDADDAMGQQRFADVLNALRSAGIENIALKGGL